MPKETKKAKVLNERVHTPAAKNKNGLKKSKKRVHGAVALKHKVVIQKIAESIGNGKPITAEKAMVEAGYSESYARGGHLTQTKSWEDLMEEFLPDDELAKHHKELMNAGRISHYKFPGDQGDNDIITIIEDFGLKCVWIEKAQNVKKAYFKVPDEQARKYALDMAYKLKKRYDNTIIVKGSISKLSDAEIEERIAAEVSATLGAIAGEGEEEDAASS